jgi:hypothetical protein
LIDIIVLLAVTFLLDAALGAFVQVPIDLEKGFVLDAIVKVLLVGVGCGLVLLRGERLADIGLKRPKSWTRTLIIGVHRHTRHFDGTAGSSVWAKSLGRDHRTRALRRESFCFVLFSRAADWLISLNGRCPTESSAIQEARIELEIEWHRDTDSLEIRMLRIEEKICVGGTNCTW